MVTKLNYEDVGATFIELGIEGEAEDAAIALIEDLGAYAREDRRRGGLEIFIDGDDSRLLGDEDAAVGGEAEGRRFVDVFEDRRVLEAGRQFSCARGCRRKQQRGKPGEQRPGQPDSH